MSKIITHLRTPLSIVSTNEMRFTNLQEVKLYIERFSGIAFIVRGVYEDDEEHRVRFCGLYPWSGFDSTPNNPDVAMNSIINNFFNALKTQLNLKVNTLIKIEHLVFLGGDRALVSVNGDLIHRGTETEVNSLMAATHDFNYLAHGIDIDKLNIGHSHYIANEDEALSIQVTINNWICVKKRFTLDTDIEDPENYSIPSFTH